MTSFSEQPTQYSKRNWPVTLTFGLTFLTAVIAVPWYGMAEGYSGWAWLFFALFLAMNGIGIGSGYHRLWSHRTYKARAPLRLFLAVMGGMALQNSILVWCARHRVHHRDVDDNEKDPYSIGRGFWFAHIGWMLRDYESGTVDYSIVPDLERDPIVAWQHRYYFPLALTTNLGLPMLLGWMVGDFWGVVLLAGLARLVVNHHVTFFINSLAHMWGSQPYTDENSARDNWFLALITYGEGYHNFHHMFQSDYRNGVRWYAFDINKWFISLASALGLACDLKRTPQFKILRARLNMEFKRARERLAERREAPGWKEVLESVEREYAEFLATVRKWQSLQMQKVQQGRQRIAHRLDASYRELENALRMQHRRLQLLTAQLYV